jgi:hypothetical protein
LGVAFVGASPAGRQAVVWVDRSSGARTTLFAVPRGGEIDGLAAYGHHVAWTYVSDPREDPTASVDWTIYSADTRWPSRARVVFRPAGPTPLPPVPAISGKTLAWVYYKGLAVQKSDIYLERLPSGTPKIAVANVRTDQIALAKSYLVFNETTVERGLATRHPKYSNDLEIVALQGGQSMRLTHQGDTDLPVTNGRWVAWRDDRKGSVFGLRLKSARPVALAHGEQGFLRIGTSFAAFMATKSGRTAIRAVPLSGQAKPVTVGLKPHLSICVPCGIATQADRLVWGVEKAGRTTLYVGSVSRLGGS